MDLTDHLRNITLPVLMINGKYDTMRGPNIRSMMREIKNVELAMLNRFVDHIDSGDDDFDGAQVGSHDND